MKDFKQTPKMNAQGSHYCGGGKVKKMAMGGALDDADIVESIRAGKVKPVEMPNRNLPPKTMTINGQTSEMKPVPMPARDYGGTDIPGVGRVKPAPMQSRGNLGLMKKGGKVKRGKISK